ncbi:MAG: 16S rRNA (cytidine(1402)-2'-O)-methyltransferase [Candidatus Omnitrophota bacterium]
MLYIVSTPIGNLGDMTFRAVEVLKAVDLIASEDTRHTGILLKRYEITTRQTSFHEHNKSRKTDELISLLQQGQDIALVSDAGTPGISDPGYRLVRAVLDNGLEVTVVPGPCAAIAGLSLSGLPTDRFVFEGFLPPKSGARRRRLEALKDEGRTVIFYESPHRLLKTLGDIGAVLGQDCQVACCREMTKKFEEVVRGTPEEVVRYFDGRRVKGEIVLAVKI